VASGCGRKTTRLSACLCILQDASKEATVAEGSPHPIFPPIFPLFPHFPPRTSFALDDAKDYQVVGMWQGPKNKERAYKLSSMLVGHYAGPNRIRISAFRIRVRFLVATKRQRVQRLTAPDPVLISLFPFPLDCVFVSMSAVGTRDLSTRKIYLLRFLNS